MPPVSFENPHLLWALPAVLGVLAVSMWRSAAVTGIGRRAVLWTLRSVWVSLCVVAVAAPSVRRVTRVAQPARVVLVRDESASVADDRAAAQRLRDEMLQALGASGVQTSELMFAGRIWNPGERPLEVDQTDIEAALDAANERNLDAPNCRVVLLTDARSTRGDAPGAAARLAMRGGSVSVMPIGRRQPALPRITAVEPPIGAKLGIASSVRVTVAADERVRGTVRLRDPDGRLIDECTLPVDGQSTLLLRFTPTEGGARNYSIELESRAEQPPAKRGDAATDPPAPASSLSANRLAGRNVPIYVEGPPRILVSDNFPQEVLALRRALEPLKVPVEFAAPAQWPRDLGPYAAVVLSDWSGKELSPDQRGELKRYVEQTGGGLVFIGGGNVVASRWRDNPLAEALPVILRERPAKVVARSPDVSVCFVFDRSGSMNGGLASASGANTSKLELVKAAIQASVQSLPEAAQVAVVAFDTRAEVIVPPTPVARPEQREQIAHEVDAARLGGGTAMAVGIEEGMRLLDGMPGEKYLIVLTDGDSIPPAGGETWEQLAGRAAASGAAWTSIAVGADADQAVLRAMARRAGGQYYYCGTGDQIPKVFVEQAKAIKRVAELKQRPFRPRAGPDADRYSGPSVEEMPGLDGMVPATARQGADVLLLGEASDPLLASWQFGLGRVVSFTSDAKAGWAAQWVSWPQYSQFWVATVQHVMRPPQSFHVRVKARSAGNRAYFLYQVHDKDDRPVNDLTGRGELRSEATVGQTGASAASVGWRQVSAGEYEASAPIPADNNSYVVTMSLESSDHKSVHYCAALSGTAGSETAETGADLARADAIARAGGGIVSSSPKDIAAITGRVREDRMLLRLSLWRYLIAAAIVLWPVDVLLRKFLS
jgi:Ca-activated chloride channel family protein